MNQQGPWFVPVSVNLEIWFYLLGSLLSSFPSILLAAAHVVSKVESSMLQEATPGHDKPVEEGSDVRSTSCQLRTYKSSSVNIYIVSIVSKSIGISSWESRKIQNITLKHFENILLMKHTLSCGSWMVTQQALDHVRSFWKCWLRMHLTEPSAPILPPSCCNNTPQLLLMPPSPMLSVTFL